MPPPAPPIPRTRLFTLWHLLSLDAPTVAVLWTCFTARLTHTALPLATPVAMALAVWTLYAADRLMDTRQVTPSAPIPNNLEARHLFHHRHRTAFLTGIALATIALAALLPSLAPQAIRLYLTEAALMAGYFLVIHIAPDARPFARHVPKELIVGPFFAAATFIPTISRNPGLRPTLLPLAILFAALCSLNCLFIHTWEHPTATGTHWTIRHPTRHLTLLATLLLAAAATLTVFSPHRAYPAACALCILALLLLHANRHRHTRLTLRTAADAALLTPLLFLPFTS